MALSVMVQSVIQTQSPPPLLGVGAVIWRGDTLVLVNRANPPLEGAWTLPGGKPVRGETLHDALRREIREETGLEVALIGLVDAVDAIFYDDSGILSWHYVLIDFTACWRSGSLCAGDDASDAVWVRRDGLDAYGLGAPTRRIIAESWRRHGPFREDPDT